MVVLSNVDIEAFIKKGKIKIEPYERRNIQGATVDFRVDGEFLIPDYYGSAGESAISLEGDFPYKVKKISNDEEIIILPHHFILGSTLEELTISNDLCARVDGRSRVGRKGLIVQTAGHIGPGFSGQITLELYNANQIPIKIKYGQGICQVEFHELKTPSTKPYTGKYSKQKGPRI